MNLRRWLTPGIGIKRWMLLVFVGLLFLALAFAYALRQATRELEPGGISQSLIDLLTLSFLPAPARVFVVAGIGLGCVAVGAVMVIRAFMDPFRSDDGRQPLVEVIYQKRFLSRGPRIVAIGGGTGLSTLLRGLKEHTSNLTAVVTVADDGGSSGVLRNELGIPPVGDIRNCIAALADAETMMDQRPPIPVPGRGIGRGRSGARRARDGQPAHRGHDGGRGRRLRGGRPADQQDPRGARAGRAGVGDAADPARQAARRAGGRGPVDGHAHLRHRARLAQPRGRPAVR